MKKITKPSFKQVYPWVLVIGGIIGLLAAAILTQEKFHLAANPDYVPSCSLSPVVACSPVIASDQASAFGFPNPYLGIAGFAMVWAVGMMVFAGAKGLKSWFWQVFNFGSLFGMFFIGYLIHAALYDIGKLCIYCMAVWAVTIPIFWTTLAYNVQNKHIKIKGKLGDLLANNAGKAIALTYLLVIVLIVARFPDYFYSLIGG